MTVGGVDPSRLGRLPPTVQVQPWLPQLAVLRQASAFVTHAEMNSTMEALYSGVPMLALPQMPEQAVNAGRVATLGLGHQLDVRAAMADVLRSALDEVLSSSEIRADLVRMQAAVRAAGGVDAGVETIETYLT